MFKKIVRGVLMVALIVAAMWFLVIPNWIGYLVYILQSWGIPSQHYRNIVFGFLFLVAIGLLYSGISAATDWIKRRRQNRDK